MYRVQVFSDKQMEVRGPHLEIVLLTWFNMGGTFATILLP